MSCNSSVQNYISKKVHNMTLRECKVWRKPFVSEQWWVNRCLEVTLRFCHLHLHQVHRSWFDFGSRRITSLKMENAKNSFKIDVISHVNLPFIQEEMTLWSISDETIRRTCNNAKMGFLTDDHDLRDKIVKVGRREIWYRTTESVKCQPVMTHVAKISKIFMNQKCH